MCKTLVALSYWDPITNLYSRGIDYYKYLSYLNMDQGFIKYLCDCKYYEYPKDDAGKVNKAYIRLSKDGIIALCINYGFYNVPNKIKMSYTYELTFRKYKFTGAYIHFDKKGTKIIYNVKLMNGKYELYYNDKYIKDVEIY